VRVCEAFFYCFSEVNYGQILLTLPGLCGCKMKAITQVFSTQNASQMALQKAKPGGYACTASIQVFLN